MFKNILTILILLISFWGSIDLLKTSAIDNVNETQYQEFRLAHGDTLWSIAKKQIDDTIDIREYIYEIKKINNIKNSAQLQAGDVIKIPIKVKINNLNTNIYMAEN